MAPIVIASTRYHDYGDGSVVGDTIYFPVTTYQVYDSAGEQQWHLRTKHGYHQIFATDDEQVVTFGGVYSGPPFPSLTTIWEPVRCPALANC